jgi:hypothetical protein
VVVKREGGSTEGRLGGMERVMKGFLEVFLFFFSFSFPAFVDRWGLLLEDKRK